VCSTASNSRIFPTPTEQRSSKSTRKRISRELGVARSRPMLGDGLESRLRGRVVTATVSRLSVRVRRVSSGGRLKPFRETLARFSDEDQKFALGDPHYVDILMRRLASHQVRDIFAGNEQRAR
jgi:hypothetical protein